MAKPRGRSVCTVQEEADDGIITEYDTQGGVEGAIWNEVHEKRFYQAEQAPIWQGSLRGDFGYPTVLPTAQSILAGTYDYPPDFDPATK